MIYAIIMSVLLIVFTMFVISRLVAVRDRYNQEKSPLPGTSQNTEV
jgi:hypothetical protein